MLAHTTNWQGHITVMKQILTKVREANLTLRPTKCSIGFYCVPYLGHYIGNNTFEPKVELVNKILEAPKPMNTKKLGSFLGLVGYYRQLIPNFAAISVPLTDITKKDEPNELVWTESKYRAFEFLKRHISKPPILKLPNFEQEFILQTDTSIAMEYELFRYRRNWELSIQLLLLVENYYVERYTILLLKRNV